MKTLGLTALVLPGNGGVPHHNLVGGIVLTLLVLLLPDEPKIMLDLATTALVRRS